jgi:hypothetical protein
VPQVRGVNKAYDYELVLARFNLSIDFIK